ncbi:MAG: hypothetical protein ABH834_03755 [Candidatus Altiarchaeota archaeon]
MVLRQTPREPETESILSAQVDRLSSGKREERASARGEIAGLCASNPDAAVLLDKRVYPAGLPPDSYGEYVTDERLPVRVRANAVAKLANYPDEAYFQPLYSIVSAPVNEALTGEARMLLRDAGVGLGVMVGFMRLAGMSAGTQDTNTTEQAVSALSARIGDLHVDEGVREGLMFGLSFVGEPAVGALVGYLGCGDYSFVRQAMNALRDMPENFDVILARRGFQFKDLRWRVDAETEFREKQHMISVLNAKAVPALETGLYETNPGRRHDYGYTYDKIRGAKATKPANLSDPETVAGIQRGLQQLRSLVAPDPADAWKMADAAGSQPAPASPYPLRVSPGELGGLIAELVAGGGRLSPPVQQQLVNCIGSTIRSAREGDRLQVLSSSLEHVEGLTSILSACGTRQGGRGLMNALMNLSGMAANTSGEVADSMLARLALAAPAVAGHVRECIYPEGGCDAFEQSSALAFLGNLVSQRERIPEKGRHALWYGVVDAIPHSAGVLGATDPIRIEGARFYGQVAEVAAGMDAESAKPIYDTFQHVATPLVDASIDSNPQVQEAALAALRSIANLGLAHRFHEQRRIRKRLDED